MSNAFIQFSTLLQQNTPTFVAFSMLLGLMVGSFLNVVIHRLPKIMERNWKNQCLELQNQSIPPQQALTLSYPRSTCPHCGHLITALENIPLFSYLKLKGRCSACNAPISPRYPLVEILTSVLTGVVSWKFGYTLSTLFLWLFIFALIALTFIDFDTQLLPDDITLPLLWLGLLFNLAVEFTPLSSAIIGAMAGYLSLYMIYHVFKFITHKEGMGYGDFKLLAAIGAWLGWQALPVVVVLSSILGAVVGVGLIIGRNRPANVPLPFGPFLALAAIVALFSEQPLLGIY